MEACTTIWQRMPFPALNGSLGVMKLAERMVQIHSKKEQFLSVLVAWTRSNEKTNKQVTR